MEKALIQIMAFTLTIPFLAGCQEKLENVEPAATMERIDDYTSSPITLRVVTEKGFAGWTSGDNVYMTRIKSSAT